eukprot:Filipodium_phascolosomae@DN519_c0_g1_i1.p1
MQQVKKEMDENPDLKKSFEELQNSKGMRTGRTFSENISQSSDQMKATLKAAGEWGKGFSQQVVQTSTRLNEMADKSPGIKVMREFSVTTITKTREVLGSITERTAKISEYFNEDAQQAREKNAAWRQRQKDLHKHSTHTAAAGPRNGEKETATAEENAWATSSDLVVSDRNYESTWDRFGFKLEDTPFLRSFYENPIVGKLLGETELSQCIRKMRTLDPYFRIAELTDQLEHVIAPHIIDTYLSGDEQSLKLHCGEVAYATVHATIKDRKVQKLELDNTVLSLKNVELRGAKVSITESSASPEQPPSFIFSFNTQQINCLRDAQGLVVAGAVDDIRQVHYAIAVQKHPTPNEPGLQYPWKIVELAIIGNAPIW